MARQVNGWAVGTYLLAFGLGVVTVVIGLSLVDAFVMVGGAVIVVVSLVGALVNL